MTKCRQKGNWDFFTEDDRLGAGAVSSELRAFLLKKTCWMLWAEQLAAAGFFTEDDLLGAGAISEGLRAGSHLMESGKT
jgi:hypothetical protein